MSPYRGTSLIPFVFVSGLRSFNKNFGSKTVLGGLYGFELRALQAQEGVFILCNAKHYII